MFSVRQTSEDQRKMEQNHAGPSESFRRSSEIQITKRKSSSPPPSSTAMSATRSRSSCVHDRKDSPLSSGSTAGVSRPVKSVGKQEHQSVVRHGTAKLKHKRRKKKITSMNDVNVKGNPDATPTIKTCYRQDHQNGSVLNISESIAPPVITANVQNESSLIGEAEQAPVKVEPLHGTVAETPQTTRSKETWTVIHQLPLPQLDGFVASFENGFRLKTENNPAKGRMRYYNCTRIKVRAKPQCSRQLLAFIPNTVGPVSVSVKGHHTCHEAPTGTVARTKITKEDLQIIDQLVGSGVPSKHVKLQMQANNSHLAKGSLNYAVKMSQKKIYGNGEMSLGELEAWVVSKSTTPEAAEQGYVIGQDIDRDNGKFRIVLSSKRMLSLLPRFRTIAADCTFKTTLQGYPLLVVCVIDEMRKAHPVAFACVTHQEHIDYEFVFRSLLTAASQHGDVNICNFLSDGEAALKNAARTVFGQSVALLNCYFHVKQNLIKHFKKSKELSADIQNQVLREVTLLQIAPTKPHFAAALELFIAKYSQYEAFSLFFDKYARNEKFALWYEAAQPGVPSTNNAIEAINKSIKHNYLKRHKEPFSTFKVQLMNIIQAYSNPERVIALDRSIALADEREAFDFLKSSKKIRTINRNEQGKIFVFVPGRNHREVSPVDIQRFENPEYRTFDAYLEDIGKIHRVEGICPGNRLKIIQPHDSGCFTLSPASSPCPSIGPGTNLNSPVPSDIYENTTTASSISSATSTTTPGSNRQQLYQNQHQGKRRSWHINPNKVLTPQKCGDVYLYDLLPTPTRGGSPYQHHQHSASADALDTYDVPKPAVPINYDTPRAWSRTPPYYAHHNPHHSPHTPNYGHPPHHHHFSYRMEESYDIPRPVNNLLAQQNLTPSSSNSSLLTSDSLSLSSSNRSSLANMPDYDVPRRNPVSIRSTPPPPQHPATPHSQTSGIFSSNHSMSISSFSSSTSTYDVPQTPLHQQQQLLHQQPPPLPSKELPLELSSALETLARLQNEATSAVSRLLGFVSPNWRTKEKLDPILMDLKLAAVRLRTALHDLAEFGDGALGNATKAEDKGLAQKLRPLVKALRDADKLVHEASQNLDNQGWTMVTLQRPEATQKLQQQLPPDSLDQLIACAQTLTEDVRQTASFIQGNGTLLFKRSTTSSTATTPQTPTGHVKSINNNNNNNNSRTSGHGEWPEDYDYVSLESKEASAKSNAEIHDALPQDLKKNFKNVVRNANAAATVGTEAKEALDPNDKSVLVYYATQTVTHMGYLTQAIDAFLQTVEHNQPPKFFLAYGKFVVLSAHNLVNIGDIVHRNVSRENVKTRVLQCADALSEALKTCVAKTKKAAQHFPSVTAVQEMVDSVVDISHLSSDLKIAMLEAVQQ